MMFLSLSICNLTQHDALVSIYESTGGQQWEKGQLWNTFAPFCTWEGITCRNKTIQQINLKEFGLSGSLPDVFNCFPNLKSLIIERNYISGPIPESFGGLTHLQNLEATGAGFVGEIPKSLYNLEFLQYIQLGENGLTGEIPAEVQNLKELHQFDVHCNDIEGKIPDEFEQLPALKELNIDCNQRIICESGLAVRPGFYFMCQNESCDCDQHIE